MALGVRSRCDMFHLDPEVRRVEPRLVRDRFDNLGLGLIEMRGLRNHAELIAFQHPDSAGAALSCHRKCLQSYRLPGIRDTVGCAGGQDCERQPGVDRAPLPKLRQT